MNTLKTNLFILLLVLFCLLIGSCNKTDTYIYCNHNSQKDTLSHLDYSGLNFGPGILKAKTFHIETHTLPDNLEIIDNNHIIDLLNNNIVINGYQHHDLSMKFYNRLDFITKLLIKFNKKTYKPTEYKPMDYNKYFPDTTFLVNDFYFLGKLELSDKFNSYVILNQHEINELDGLFFLRNETSYYLLNIDHSKKLISTIQLACYITDNSGLSISQKKLKLKFLFKHWFYFVHDSYIKATDLIPNVENRRKTIFLLRLTKNGEIKKI